MMRVLTAVGVGEVCGDVQRAWEPFMERVHALITEAEWKALELPETLPRSMFGMYLSD